MTIIAYLVIAALIYFAVPSMLQILCVGLWGLGRRALRIPGTASGTAMNIPLLFGGFAAWAATAFLWQLAEGGTLPIAVLAGGFVFLFVHAFLTREELTPDSQRMMTAEAWAILLFAGVTIWKSGVVRWY